MIHSVDIHVNTFFRKNVLMTPTLPIADRWPMGGGVTFEQRAAHRVYENKELRRRIFSGKVAKLGKLKRALTVLHPALPKAARAAPIGYGGVDGGAQIEGRDGR